jgi:hypothetical protein
LRRISHNISLSPLLSQHAVTRQLKVGVEEQEEAAVAGQRRGKYFSAATDGDAEIADAVFSMWPLSRLYSKDQQHSHEGIKCNEVLGTRN